ncbi:ABC transporter ATP-binding protein [Nitratireductor sp. ZSWI3]|uniref:ABC transporter ATP-binding protein n=1 Tax=Nitratireductor sp. ZSWI3 TaxID=2966359 RepID=UPI00214FFD39|nr:sn-glycerol-3-phosphate ABC transporter ATP-binding protein UgpC [Nitratireductor sp. ZSWI3]MCR4265829.1 sn-glycerol-3-phosphate ABC transporter ATP-binding protein UgpC [Nitratireductor sp. ZSWI3]
MASLVAQNINKAFGGYTALDNVTIEAKSGEFLVLLGPSGCGKSTLLSIIAGLETLTDGEVLIDGELVNHLDPKDRDIAMVFQSYALYPSMTVRENISFGLKIRGVPKPQREEAVQRVAKMLKLESMLDRRPSQLSGGQRQRVAMGRALVRDPKIFLFDEPLSNLDAKLRVEMRTEIKKLHSILGVTIVYVTHDQIEAMTLATKVVVMKEARIQQIGTPQEIYDQPQNTYVARFIGSPPMNLVPGSLERSEGGTFVRVASASEALHIPVSSDLGRPADAGREVFLGVRPETIFEANRTGPEVEPFRFDVKLDVIEPTGSDDLAIFDLGGQEVTARLRPGSGTAGEQIALAVDLNKAVLFDARSGNRIGNVR